MSVVCFIGITFWCLEGTLINDIFYWFISLFSSSYTVSCLPKTRWSDFLPNVKPLWFPMETSHTNNNCKVFYRLPVPSSLQHLTASFAFWGESFLFTNHTHGEQLLIETKPANQIVNIHNWTVFFIPTQPNFYDQVCRTCSSTPTVCSTFPLISLPASSLLSLFSPLCGSSLLSGKEILINDNVIVINIVITMLVIDIAIVTIKSFPRELIILRNLCICLHGSWLMQSAFILYSPQVS